VIYDLFVLIRKHGVKTDTALTLSSAHCPSCGAAVRDEAANACAYCGSVLNDGSSDWVLENILKVYTPEAQALREQLRTGDPTMLKRRAMSSLEQAGWMVQVMLADGQINDREMETQLHFAERRQIPLPRIEALITAIAPGSYGARAVHAGGSERMARLHAEMVLPMDHLAKEKEAMVNMRVPAIPGGGYSASHPRKRTSFYSKVKNGRNQRRKNTGGA
jgi:hypothetical protein